mgnify:CR=1 FL=1
MKKQQSIYGEMKTELQRRQEAEREFVKEAIISLEDEVGIPKKYLGKMARIYHKQNMSEIVSEIEEIEALLESVK